MQEISRFTVYQLARQNTVLPIFSKFGKFLKTHRLLRQYLWLAFFPYVFATLYTNYWVSDQAESLWAVHAQRLNNKYSLPHQESSPTQLHPNTHANYSQWVKWAPGSYPPLTDTIWKPNGPMKPTLHLLQPMPMSILGRRFPSLMNPKLPKAARVLRKSVRKPARNDRPDKKFNLIRNSIQILNY